MCTFWEVSDTGGELIGLHSHIILKFWVNDYHSSMVALQAKEPAKQTTFSLFGLKYKVPVAE